ncbi:MAG: glucosamine-6-phosphate deaminase [Butyrivibrio sp.]|nr:glucosamine-6-phosphate deaminase [Butyrivibrio sp.]
MRFIQAKDYEDMSRIAADIIAAQVILKPDSVLGLATGSSPEGIYRKLIESYGKGELDFSRATSINLDEYKGLDGENSQSYRYYMDYHLFDFINIDKKRTFIPDGTIEDAEEACRLYDGIISDNGPVTLQLLGIGCNGHIGFNEPAEEFSAGTHCVDLAESTIMANARFFDSIYDVPRQAITMGIGSIMQAEKILLIASGKSKAKAIKEAFCGKITPKVPASILQLHKDVIVVGDMEAFSEMELKQ